MKKDEQPSRAKGQMAEQELYKRGYPNAIKNIKTCLTNQSLKNAK